MKSKSPAQPPYSPAQHLKPYRRKGKGYKLGPREGKPIPPNALWINGKQVCERYGGRSAMWLWRKVRRDPKFPKPRFDGRVQLFSVAEFDAYDRALISERVDAPTPRKPAQAES